MQSPDAPMVGRQMVGLPVNRERGVTDSVGDRADHSSQKAITGVVHIFIQCLVS